MSYNIDTVRQAIGSVEGKTADEVKTLILTKGKVPFKHVNKVYKDLGFTTVRSSYASEFYDQLRAKPMSEAAFKKWIAEGSANVKRHTKHYDAIRKLANDIHATK